MAYGIKNEKTGLWFAGFGPGPDFSVLWGPRAASFSTVEIAESQIMLLARDGVDLHSSFPFPVPVPFAQTAQNVCVLLRDAWRIIDDGPDDSDKAMANEKIGEAMALARIVCKESGLT